MKQLFVLILITLSYSCTEKTVQLPETINQDVTEVLDISPVYMFYNEENDSLEFNRKNMISTTNWLVNIDKRLTLKQILPHLQYLQDKRHGSGMHKNENARNYFTCNNTDLKNLSFIEFTDVVYQTNLDNDNDPNFLSEDYLGIVRFNSMEFVEIISEYEESTEIEEYTLNSVLNNINELTKSNKVSLKMSFNSNISFQEYISIKSKFLAIKSDSLEILSHEVIHN
jgi:hypothetical protein